MQKKKTRRPPSFHAVALAATASIATACAGGVQHIYPQEEATSDRFDPRPDSNERQPGLFSRGALEWVRELPGGAKQNEDDGGEETESRDATEDREPPPSLPPIDQDPGPGGA